MFAASKVPPHFDVNLNPLPFNLKSSLELVSKNFYNSRMRNLDLFYNSDPDSKLYGLMTNYEGHNFCWIQPTRVKSKTPDYEYDKYICRINHKDTNLRDLSDPQPGQDCVALYEVDSHWYRAVVVRSVSDDRWLVLFIDYGNFQICYKHQLRVILSDPMCDHFHAPMQAVCCRIYNIAPITPEHQEDIDIYMERFFVTNSNHFVEIKVRNIRQDYVVDCDIFAPKSNVNSEERFYGQHILQPLVDGGVATFVDPRAAHAKGTMAHEVIDLTS